MTQKTKPLLLIKIKYWDENSVDTVISMPVGRVQFSEHMPKEKCKGRNQER